MLQIDYIGRTLLFTAYILTWYITEIALQEGIPMIGTSDHAFHSVI